MLARFSDHETGGRGSGCIVTMLAGSPMMQNSASSSKG
jgi:hypothetical protein